MLSGVLISLLIIFLLETLFLFCKGLKQRLWIYVYIKHLIIAVICVVGVCCIMIFMPFESKNKDLLFFCCKLLMISVFALLMMFVLCIIK